MPIIDKMHIKDQNGTEQSFSIGADAVNVTFNPDATGSSPNSVNTRIQDTIAHMNKKAVTDSTGVHGMRYNSNNNKFEIEITTGQQSPAGGGGEGDMTKAEFVNPQSNLLLVSKGGTGNANGYVQIGALSGSTIGIKATAEGNNTIAQGNYSHAEGYKSSAIGVGAHAEGGTQTEFPTSGEIIEILGGTAIGGGSHAEGVETSAIEMGSHAEGSGTCAAGLDSHAEGGSTTAKGADAHAEGWKTYAQGFCSHAEGGYNGSMLGESGTFAIGQNAHAEGYYTSAQGNNSHAEGNSTYASGSSSHAEGYQTCTENDYAHAEGYNTYAGGVSSHAEGENTTACGSESHAEGSSTYAQGTGSHAEGLDTYAGKVGTYGGGAHAEGINTTAYSKGAHAEGYKSYAKGNGSHAEGGYTTSTGSGGTFAIGDNSHAEGYGTTAYEDESHAEGTETYAGSISHAEGGFTSAFGIYNHTEGVGTITDEECRQSHAEGYHTTAKGDASHAEGYYTLAKSEYSHAEGYSTTAKGDYSHAEGSQTTASEDESHAEGYATSATNFASHAGGHINAAMTTGGSYNNTTGTAFVIGNGTSFSSTGGSNAFSVQYDGTVRAKGSITGNTTADYAEFFEQNDNNTEKEDRVGYFVTFDNGKKIKIASAEDSYILGIISGAPFVVGNGDCDTQTKMEIRDEFNRIQYEPAPLYEKNEETGELELVLDDKGNPVYQGTKPIYNPDYDPSQSYISRDQRSEQAAVGMLGVLPVRDDGTCEVNGYCTVADGGIATKATDESVNKYRVIGRKTENVVEVVFR